MARNPDVIVVGGGIIGCAVAYYLTHAGAKVQIFEREALGSQASGVAAGLLIPLAEHPEPGPFLTLALESLQMHRLLAQELRDKTGIDVHLEETPVLMPAFSEAEAQTLRNQAARLEALGLDVHWVDAKEARAWEPAVSPETLGALLSRAEAQVEPYPLVLALARAAEQGGASFHYAEVTGLRRNQSGALEVVAGSQTLTAGVVVLAMGPWTVYTSEWLGTPIPVLPQRGQLLHLDASTCPLQCILFHQGSYLTPKPNKVIIAGATEEAAGFEVRTTPQGTSAIMEKAVQLAPAIADAGMVKALAGLRPLSADGLPLLGPIPGWDDVFMATGHGRNGVLLGPITGRLLKDWITGSESPAEGEAFSLRRFIQPAPPGT